MIEYEGRTYPSSLPSLQQIAHADPCTNLTRRHLHLRLRPPASSTVDDVNVPLIVSAILKCRGLWSVTSQHSDQIIPQRNPTVGFSGLSHSQAVSLAPTHRHCSDLRDIVDMPLVNITPRALS